MKKRIKLLLIVSVLFIVLIAIYLAVTSASKGTNEQIQEQNGDTVFIDRQASEVISVTYRTGGSEFAIVKSGGRYVLKEDEDFPLDTTTVQYMTNAVARLVSVRRINPEGEELDEFGLTEPHSIIDVAYEGGAKLSLKIGNYNPYADAYYCTVGDGFVYLFGGDFTEAFDYTYSDLLLDESAETPQYGFSSLTEIILTVGDKKTSFVFEGENGEGAWVKDGEDGDCYREAYMLYNELFGFYAENWVSYNIRTEEQFALYGLEPAEIRVLFKHIELEETVVNDTPTVKQTERETAFLIGSAVKADDENGARYFAYGGGSVIYVIEENDLPLLFDLIEID